MSKPQIPDEFVVDYAPTGRAVCKRCGTGISQDTVRFGRKVRSPWHDGFDIQYNHLKCGYSYAPSLDKVKGWQALHWRDIERCAKYYSTALDGEHPKIQECKETAAMVWKLRKELGSLTMKPLKSILDLNEIFYREDKMKAYEAVGIVADGLLLGLLPACPICETNALRQTGQEITCGGWISGATKCAFKWLFFDMLHPNTPPDNSAMGVSDDVAETLKDRKKPFLLPREMRSLTTFKKMSLEKCPSVEKWGEDPFEWDDEGPSEPESESEGETEQSVPKYKELLGMRFNMIGKLPKTRAWYSTLIEKHGGELVEEINADITYLLVGDDPKAKATKRYKDALTLGVPIIHIDLLHSLIARKIEMPLDPPPPKKKGDDSSEEEDDIRPQGLILRQRRYAKFYEIAGGPRKNKIPRVTKLIAEAEADGIAEEEEEKRLTEKRTRPPIKKGSQILRVDRDCRSGGEIYVDELNNAWTCTLNLADINTGINKFYTMHVIHVSKTRTILFKKWGRVGSDHRMTNDSKTETFRHLDDAQSEFCGKYTDLTGTDWDDRFTAKQLPGKYRYVDIEGHMHDGESREEKSEEMKAEPSTPSTLSPESVQSAETQLHQKVHDFVKLIFDKKMMEEALVAHNLDLKKMPLGSISSRQLKEGYGILKEIQDLILVDEQAPSTPSSGSKQSPASKSPKASQETNSSQTSTGTGLQKGSLKYELKLKDASNRFYNAIPHFFHVTQVPPVITSLNALKIKIDLMEQLLDISVANRLMADANMAASEKNPVDAEYQAMKCKLEPLEVTGDNANPQHVKQFNMIKKMVSNTHGQTHNSFKIKVEDVFVCERQGEKERFKTDIGNRKLLWHGSRLTNWGGILSQGLRIAPPEAPVSGYMFDKGIYFADMVSKSAQYCMASSNNNTAVLILCEVALGKTYRRNQAQSNAGSKAKERDCSSCWGIGSTHPDPKMHIHIPSAFAPQDIIDAATGDDGDMKMEDSKDTLNRKRGRNTKSPVRGKAKAKGKGKKVEVDEADEMESDDDDDEEEMMKEINRVRVALGKGVSNKQNQEKAAKDPATSGGMGGLMYNEFIVYDTAQVKIRYVVKTTVSYKSLSNDSSDGDSSDSD
eukprot:GHVN01083003.1.p1 GENE.GHVN01083003.1~~GHVN01083003.1.p1  ORF type:complete len:1108 (-),score=235.99 GHVN01083003.1:259-3582(-)